MLVPQDIPSTIAPMSRAAIDAVTKLQEYVIAQPQVEVPTDHVLHAGLYSRTIIVPPDIIMTGVLIKVASILIVSGDADVWLDGRSVRFEGYHVLTAGAGRKQALVTRKQTAFTMIFATKAKTVEEAEIEFTDDHESLASRRYDNTLRITED